MEATPGKMDDRFFGIGGEFGDYKGNMIVYNSDGSQGV
jgi:hypothetical protein